MVGYDFIKDRMLDISNRDSDPPYSYKNIFTCSFARFCIYGWLILILQMYEKLVIIFYYVFPNKKKKGHEKEKELGKPV